MFLILSFLIREIGIVNNFEKMQGADESLKKRQQNL